MLFGLVPKSIIEIDYADIFDYADQEGCVAKSIPDGIGNFEALDSAGEPVTVNINQVRTVYWPPSCYFSGKIPE